MHLKIRSISLLIRRTYFHSVQSLIDVNNYDLSKIEANLEIRNQFNNVPIIRSLLSKINRNNASTDDKIQLQREFFKLPNETHERLLAYGTEPKRTYLCNPSECQKKSSHEFSDVCKMMNNLRVDHLGNYTGHKSYYLFGKLAELEQAIIQYTLSALKKKQFCLISVPDILPKDIIEACGMQTEGNRTQVYKLDSGHCLSGTSEMALAAFFANKQYKEEDLPIKVAAVSRCYRAETSGLNQERGIYRVHQFTKIEMFSVCSEQQSEDMVDHFKDIEIELFRNLHLDLCVLDMPPNELGTAAYQKYDIEAWMPGRQMWGEISSCSNCTNYQAKRLNIRYVSKESPIERYAHTVNGTAAALPRLLIALIESHQTHKTIEIPDILCNWLQSSTISKEEFVPELKLVKHIKSIM